MRILRHPILGMLEVKKEINFKFNGNDYLAFDGDSIASALIANDIKIFRYSEKKHEARSIFCGIGKCNDCNMTVNGISNVKTCITKLEEGMLVESS